MKIGSVKNHRSREKGSLVYPVYSRRAQGLSLGINLFPDKKTCSFDCPYCEVFPFSTGILFSLDNMEKELMLIISEIQEQNTVIKDICFSGNGEPTLSPLFPEALEKAFYVRNTLAPNVQLVLISNGTGLLSKAIFDILVDKAQAGLCIWLKIDAATAEWFKKINRAGGCDFDLLLNRIHNFSSLAPFTIQTMLCKVDAVTPPQEEEDAWLNLVRDLASPGKLRSVQIYGKARPSPEDPLAQAADISLLEKRALALRAVLPSPIPVEVYP